MRRGWRLFCEWSGIFGYLSLLDFWFFPSFFFPFGRATQVGLDGVLSDLVCVRIDQVRGKLPLGIASAKRARRDDCIVYTRCDLHSVDTRL